MAEKMWGWQMCKERVSGGTFRLQARRCDSKSERWLRVGNIGDLQIEQTQKIREQSAQ